MKSLQLSNINLIVDTIIAGRYRIIIDEPSDKRISAAVLGQQISENSFFKGCVSATEAEVMITKDLNIEDLMTHLAKVKFKPDRRRKKYMLPVCFEEGIDWDDVEQQLSMDKEKVIKKLKQSDISIASFGFLPGFVYMSGLPTEIQCHRKSKPEARVPAGSFGLGGPYAGIYHIVSPGGWQIIGNCPVSLFNSDTFECPLKVNDRLVIQPITIDEHKILAAESMNIEMYQKR